MNGANHVQWPASFHPVRQALEAGIGNDVLALLEGHLLVRHRVAHAFSAEQSEDENKSEIKGQRSKKEEWGEKAS